jgi:hypothetical protein
MPMRTIKKKTKDRPANMFFKSLERAVEDKSAKTSDKKPSKA